MEANRPSTSHTTHTAPRDIACVSIDTSASCAEHIKQLAYSNTDISLQDRLRAYACSLS